MANTLPTEANLSNGYGLPESDSAEPVLHRLDASLAERSAKRARRIKRVGRGLIATGLLAAGAVGAKVLDSDQRPTARSEATSTPSDEETTQTTMVKVEEPGAGVFSTGDKLAEMGQIEPENLAEYKQKAVELHGTGPVEINSEIAYPVDHMQPDQHGTQLSSDQTTKAK